ncbi:hypothetical protein Nepgr_031377 [Nepenthes gracilis]|uniref:TFIIB-type domain-containing protein n=1 Tax=Nepenthes gracilis TaxID=150966 RepID=A0AAD3Y707_NEPGR|nr:hypothetical protein Nepgr_031377 [Nepenthes gracilis]
MQFERDRDIVRGRDGEMVLYICTQATANIVLVLELFEIIEAKSVEHHLQWLGGQERGSKNINSHSCIHDQIIQQRKRPGCQVYSVTPQVYEGSSLLEPLYRKGRALLDGVANADLVLLVATRPTTGNTLAWAVACERDQWGRAIAGHVNVAPRHLTAEAETLLPATLIHEEVLCRMNALDDLYSAGDTACSECGLVLESHSIDETSGWRTFANESNDNYLVRVAGGRIAARILTVLFFLLSRRSRLWLIGFAWGREFRMELSLFFYVFSLESFEAGSAGRVGDCILALKSYHEWKQTNAGDGFYKNVKSPLVLHSANKNLSRPLNALSTDACRHLDMSAEDGDKGSLEDSIVKAITVYMVGTKENISNNLLASFHTGKLES